MWIHLQGKHACTLGLVCSHLWCVLQGEYLLFAVEMLSHNFLLELYLTCSELRAIHPYHPATKAGFGEEVSVVEGLGCIIGRLFSLLAIDWSCLGLAADQSLFIRSRKRLWIWKKKKRLMLKNVFHMWGKITLWIFFFLKKRFSVQRRKICSSRQEWSMCTNLAHEMQRR